MPVKFRELLGDYPAEIQAVEVEANQFFDPEQENSTENVLSITFQLEDPKTEDPYMHTQKFVTPLTEGKGLFQQLMELLGELPDIEGGEFDEQKFVGLKMMVNMDKNKKGYPTIMYITKLADTESTSKGTTAPIDTDPPAFLDD